MSPFKALSVLDGDQDPSPKVAFGNLDLFFRAFSICASSARTRRQFYVKDVYQQLI